MARDLRREMRRLLARVEGNPKNAGSAVADIRKLLTEDRRHAGDLHGEVVSPQYPRKPRPRVQFFEPLIVPHRVMVVADIAQIAAGGDSPTLKVEFSSGEGWLVGWRGSTRADGSDTGRASLGVRLNLNGNEPLITNGQTEDYAIFDTLFPRGAATWSPLLIPVNVKDILRIDIHNYHTVNAYTPVLSFGFHDGLDLFSGQLQTR